MLQSVSDSVRAWQTCRRTKEPLWTLETATGKSFLIFLLCFLVEFGLCPAGFWLMEISTALWADVAFERTLLYCKDECTWLDSMSAVHSSTRRLMSASSFISCHGLQQTAARLWY